MEQLEKLDETRLLAFVGMYVEKQRHKQWFDKNLKERNFAVGDLVLLYTLKKSKRKLKKQGLGPYVIHSLLSSGAVKLATLDGEEMSTFINGSRLKRFYEPLTQPMLEQIHSAKTKKEDLETLKREAQEEAQQWKLKMKERKEAQVYVVDHSDSNCVPPFLIQVQLLNNHTSCIVNAMTDSRSACNLMSHMTWEKLGKPTLSSSKLDLIDFKGERSPAIGEILLKVQIHDQDMFISFQVLLTNGCDWQLLLGRT